MSGRQKRDRTKAEFRIDRDGGKLCSLTSDRTCSEAQRGHILASPLHSSELSTVHHFSLIALNLTVNAQLLLCCHVSVLLP